jgi:RNA polymerase sigma-70 factor (ECF subfamily)
MTNEPDDNTLVQGCLGGDDQAFGVLVLRYQGPVFNAILRMVRDRDDATDLTQSAFLKAHREIARFDDRHKFFSWIYRIAINEALNHLKRNRRQEPLDGDWASDERDPERALVGTETSRLVQDALMRISPDSRAVLILRHFHECSYEEMAAVLGIPEKTVKSRLFSARRQLRELLEAQGLMP